MTLSKKQCEQKTTGNQILLKPTSPSTPVRTACIIVYGCSWLCIVVVYMLQAYSEIRHYT